RYTPTNGTLAFANDPEVLPPTTPARATSYHWESPGLVEPSSMGAYAMDDTGSGYRARPFAYIDKPPNPSPPGDFDPATAHAMLNDEGKVVRLIHGPAPLWGERRGEDVQMTNVLAFDLRVYDPGAPIFATWKDPKNQSLGMDVIITPSD